MLNKLLLTNFRNFEKKDLDFEDGINVIVAPNASGKTNILESIFALSTGKSFKARVEAEAIKHDENLARIIGLTNNDKLELLITTGENGWPRKKFMINGVSRRMADFGGVLKAILFGPWDMDLVTESPSVRRKFLDTVLSITDREYRRNLHSYEKGLRQRNKLLLRIREENISRTHLHFWNQLLVKNGDYVSSKREGFIDFVNSNQINSISGYNLVYDKSAISDKRLEQYKNEEVAAATTLVGPHRDDFVFKLRQRDLSSFGSRGEQRIGVLWIKLQELDYIQKTTNQKPVLLLDDIFSELDHEHRELVIDTIQNHQVIMTTADEHFLESFKKDNLKVIKL